MSFAVEHGMSERRACTLAGLHRSTNRYRTKLRFGDSELLERLKSLREKHSRFGIPRMVALLRQSGFLVNHKRVERLWRAAGYQVIRRRKRSWKRPKKVEVQQPEIEAPQLAEYPDHVWSYDFIEDGLVDGRKLRILNVLDEYTREWLAVKAGVSMSGRAVVSVLVPLFRERGAPGFVRSDNGGEFIAAEVKEALRLAGATPAYIAPGSPWQNGFVESFHGKLRDECLDREVFVSVKETQVCLEGQRRFYNEERPHSSLGYASPRAFRRRWGERQEEHEKDITPQSKTA